MVIGYDKTKEKMYGKFDKTSTDEFLQKNQDKIDESRLICIAYPIAGSSIKRYRSITFMTAPLTIDDNISYMIAYKAAKKYGVNLTKYDFGRGEDEMDERNVFYIECFDVEEIKPSIERIANAQKMLDDDLNNILLRLVPA